MSVLIELMRKLFHSQKQQTCQTSFTNGHGTAAGREVRGSFQDSLKTIQTVDTKMN